MAVVAGFQSSFLVTSQPGVAFTDEATSTSDNITYVISNALKRYLDKSVPTVVQVTRDEVQLVTISGGVTGGSFKLIFGGNTTSAIAWNASAATVQAALVALASVGASNMLVTGPAGGPWSCEFTAARGNTNQVNMTYDISLLTGGTPAMTVVETQSGGTTATPTGFTLYRCNARVVFAIAQVGTCVVRLHSGQYLPYTTLGEAASCEFSGKMEMLPADVFQGAGGNGAKVFVPGTLTGTMKTNTWWLNQTRVQSVLARDLLAVSFVTATGNRYEGFCYAQDCNIKTDPKSLVGQDLSFQLTDEFFTS